jgi:threonine synthase
MKQLGRQVPDVIAYPTGGGVGIIGIYKALLKPASLEGAFVCPEGAAALEGLKKPRASGWLKAGETAVLLNRVCP